MAKQTFTTGQVLTAAQMTSLQQTAMGGGSATAKTASYVLVAADAGGTVAMNAAGATTITVNTALFAAGDTVFIQNLGAGNCTVTAGTATVASAGSLILPQYDAGILYFTATGASIFYDYIQTGAVSPLTTKGDLYTYSTSDARLAVGTNTYVLTADSAEATGLKWAAPASGLTFVGCRAYKSGGSQTLANNTATAITFDAEEFDTDAFHSTVSNTSRFTIPSGKAGKYFFEGFIILTSGTNIRNLDFNVNGASARYLYQQPGVSNAASWGLGGSAIMSLSVGDYVELVASQTSGGNLTTGTGIASVSMACTYLGA